MTAEEEREKLLADLGREARVVAGREIYFDWEGFFWDPNDWNEEVAKILARESGLQDLSEAHWKVLHFFQGILFLSWTRSNESPFERRRPLEPG